MARPGTIITSHEKIMIMINFLNDDVRGNEHFKSSGVVDFVYSDTAAMYVLSERVGEGVSLHSLRRMVGNIITLCLSQDIIVKDSTWGYYARNPTCTSLRSCVSSKFQDGVGSNAPQIFMAPEFYIQFDMAPNFIEPTQPELQSSTSEQSALLQPDQSLIQHVPHVPRISVDGIRKSDEERVYAMLKEIVSLRTKVDQDQTTPSVRPPIMNLPTEYSDTYDSDVHHEYPANPTDKETSGTSETISVIDDTLVFGRPVEKTVGKRCVAFLRAYDKLCDEYGISLLPSTDDDGPCFDIDPYPPRHKLSQYEAHYDSIVIAATEFDRDEWAESMESKIKTVPTKGKLNVVESNGDRA